MAEDYRNVPLDNMGPLLAYMDRQLRDLRASIDALRGSQVIEQPSPSLVSEIGWIRSQLETDRARLARVLAFLRSLPTNDSVNAAISDADSLGIRVGQLLEATAALESNLGVPGAADAAAGLDRGTAAVGDLITRLEARAAGMAPAELPSSTAPTTTGDRPGSCGGLVVPVIIAVLAGILVGALVASD